MEYKNYKESCERGEIYYTGFFIMLDCSGSGPQIVSLIFLLQDFAQYLNLTGAAQRMDLYVGLIKKFIKENATKYLKEECLKDEKFLIEMRSVCKTPIMTQMYGISFYKFFKDIEKGLLQKKDVISNFVVVDYEIFMKQFINDFWKYLRQLALFKLRDFFNVVGDNLRKANLPLTWSLLGYSRVTVDYKKSNRKRFDYTDRKVGRVSLTSLKASPLRDYAKQRSSAQPHFIHNIDAIVNLFILYSFPSMI